MPGACIAASSSREDLEGLVHELETLAELVASLPPELVGETSDEVVGGLFAVKEK
jgi:hypothetical protein